jgi:hypothetical protein
MLSPSVAGLFADLMLGLHVAVTAFVVLVLPLVLLGGWRRWSWVRNFWLRAAHLGLIGYIAAQAWLGELCPLTVWERALRDHAGLETYQESFIEYWLGQLLYIDAPWEAFVAAYTVFLLLVALAWWWVPPRRLRRVA